VKELLLKTSIHYLMIYGLKSEELSPEQKEKEKRQKQLSFLFRLHNQKMFNL